MNSAQSLPTASGTAVQPVRQAFQQFIIEENHPCVMAQSIFRMENYQIHTYRDFGSRQAAMRIYDDLQDYLEGYDFTSNDFFTFIAAFPEDVPATEVEFEKLLWDQLQQLHDIDQFDWDAAVSSDPEDKNFSFSIAGQAFYIVGLHPNSSRMARQSPYPAMVFNLHWQFERLREMGAYQTVRDKIRKRDKKLQGSINPMLRDFGHSSEARQYSGRKTDKAWKCPFHRLFKSRSDG